MANPYSYLNNFNEPLYSPNFGLIQQALQYKQDKLDTNRANLQKYYDDTIASLDVLKTQDRDYVNQRITAVTDLVNQYASQDLSSPGLSQALQSDVSQIVDDNVRNAVVSTTRFRAEQKAWEEYKLKNPEKYSQLNYDFATQGALQYLNDGKVGSVYQGGGGVRPYVDVEGDLNKFLGDYFKDKGIEMRIDDNGNQYYYDIIKERNISKGEVQQAMSLALSPQHMDQLAINAWGSFRGADDNTVLDMYANKINGDVEKNNDYLKQIQLDLDNPNISDQDKEYLRQTKTRITSQNNALKNTDFSKVSRSQAVNDLYMSGFNDKYTSAYSVDGQILDIKRQDNKIELEKFKQAFEINKMTMQNAFDLEKQARALAAKGSTPGTRGLTGGIDADGNPIIENRVTTTPTQLEDKTDTYTMLSGNATLTLNSLIKDGVVDNIFAEGVDADIVLNKIKNFGEGDVDENFLKFNGKDITEEQRTKLLELKDNYKKLSTFNDELYTALNATKNEMVRAVKQAEDFNPITDLDDYGFKLIKNKQGEFEFVDKVSAPSWTGVRDLSYGELMAKNEEDLTEEQKATLDAYNSINFAKSAMMADPSLKNKLAINSFLLKEAGKYKNGKTYMPVDVRDFQEGTRFVTIDSSPSEHLSIINTDSYGRALDKIANEFFDGKTLVEIPDYEFDWVAGNFTSLKFPKYVEDLADKIKNNPDYVFTEGDKRNMDIVKRRKNSSIINSSKADGNFYKIGRDDLEYTQQEGDVYDINTLKQGNFKSLYNESIERSLESATSLNKYNKGVQEFVTYVENPTQKQKVLDQLKVNVPGIQLKYFAKEKRYGDIIVKVDKNNKYTISGDFVKTDKDGKEVPVSTSALSNFVLDAEELNKVGLGYSLEKATTYDVSLGVDKASSNKVNTKIDSASSGQIVTTFMGKLLNQNIPSLDQQALINYAKSAQTKITSELVPTENGYDIVYKGYFPDANGNISEEGVEFDRYSTNRPLLQIDEVSNFIGNSKNVTMDHQIIDAFADRLLQSAIEAGVINTPNPDINSSAYQAQALINQMTVR